MLILMILYTKILWDVNFYESGVAVIYIFVFVGGATHEHAILFNVGTQIARYGTHQPIFVSWFVDSKLLAAGEHDSAF